MNVKKIIAKALGALWILDGLLQFQPAMFGQNFVTDILVPNLSSQPAWIQAIVNWGIHTWSLNPALCDLGAGVLQIAIGLLFFMPLSSRWFKIGAWVSIVWGIVVWLCGEGAGQLLTGVASFYTGAPGAVLLYVALAVLLLMKDIRTRTFVAIGALVFILGAALQLQSAFWSVSGVQGAAMAAMMEPHHVLSAFPNYISTLLGLNPVLANWILVLLPLVMGVWLLRKPSRTAGIVGLFLLFFIWWVGQDFGMLSTFPTGTATDPDTAPLLALFLLPLFARRRGDTLEA